MDLEQFIEIYINASEDVRNQIEEIVSSFEEQSAYPLEASECDHTIQ